MGSVVSRKSVSKPHCCRSLLSPHTFVLHGFPPFSFSSRFHQPFSPRGLLHPCSFVLVSSYFSVSLSLSLCLSFCLILTVPALHFCFSVFQTDGRSRGHGEGSGWGDGLQGGGLYCGRHPVREIPGLLCFSYLSLFSFSVLTLP